MLKLASARRQNWKGYIHGPSSFGAEASLKGGLSVLTGGEITRSIDLGYGSQTEAMLYVHIHKVQAFSLRNELDESISQYRVNAMYIDYTATFSRSVIWTGLSSSPKLTSLFASRSIEKPIVA